MADLNSNFRVSLCQLPSASVAKEAIDLNWVRDPFDRLIVANARANGNTVLITKDRLILRPSSVVAFTINRENRS